MTHAHFALALGAAVAVALPELVAQAPPWHSLVTISDEPDERARLAHLAGGKTTDGYLLRTASSLSPALSGDSARFRWALLAPEVTTIGNSSIPFSLNDGAMWAGSGWNERIRAGVRLEWGRFFLIMAPELLASENEWYEMPHPVTVPARPPERHPLSSPWHIAPSIDAPLRFGTGARTFVDAGQSTFGARLGALVSGLSTENEWWGPGIRNAIVLSDHAAGIPRAFVRTARPVPTRFGTVEGSWFLGGLFESRYFDALQTNDRRSISGLAFVWHPVFELDLALGLARTVYAPLDRWADLPGHLFDVLRGRGTRPTGDSGSVNSREQILSVFGRWVFPAERFAVHFEWARTELPTSLRDFLTAPNHSQGYTLGLEWATPVGAGRDLLRLQAEATYLEKSPSYRDRPLGSFYTSGSVPQGYTQRGQVIGAAIGQGSSSQWLALDYFAPRWRVGAFGGRIRWDDDALYTFPSFYENKWCSHDVSLFAGVTAAYAGRVGRVRATLTRGERLNMFFYHINWCGPTAPDIDIVDARNTTLELRISLP